MAKEKKTDSNVKLEWELSCNTNNQRGHVYDQHEINELYTRNVRGKAHGATKTCHLKNHFGNDFECLSSFLIKSLSSKIFPIYKAIADCNEGSVKP